MKPIGGMFHPSFKNMAAWSDGLLKNVLAFFHSCAFPPTAKDLDTNIQFQDARRWASEYSPTLDVDSYEAALKYAERHFDQRVAALESLDKKFDDLTRLATAITAVLATAARILGLEWKNSHSFFWLGMSIFWLIVTIVLAIVGRTPAEVETPMAIRTLIKLIEHSFLDSNMSRPSRRQVEAAVCASYHAASSGIMVLNEWKAGQLRRAMICFILGIVLLFLVFITSFSNGRDSNSPTSPVLRSSRDPAALDRCNSGRRLNVSLRLQSEP